MIRPYERPKEKTAAALAGNTAASQNTQHPDGNAAGPDMASVQRVLHQRLAQLGLSPCSGSDGQILLAGRAFDLRSATLMARQLGRCAA